MPHALTRAIGTLSTLVLACAASTALAAPPARLVYSRSPEAESCPDEAALRRAIAERVGYDSFFPWANRTIIASVLRRNGVFVASVELVDEKGIRHGGHELRSEGACSELLDAVALAVAIAIDPQLILAKPTASRPSPSAADATATPTVTAAPAASPPAPLPPADRERPAPEEAEAPSSPPEHRPLVLELSLGDTGSIGVTPRPSLGGNIGAALRWQRFSLGVEGFLAAPSTIFATHGGAVTSWPAVGSLVPCVYFGPVFGCALGQTGAVSVAGQDVRGARSASSTWWAAGGRVGFVVRAHESFFLRFRLDVVGDLSPATLRFNGTDQWTAPLVAGSLGADAIVRFP